MLVPVERGSIQDITFDYVNFFYGDKLDMEGKKKIYLAFHNLLNQGWTLKEIYNKINNYINSTQLNIDMVDLQYPEHRIGFIFGKYLPKEINLLKQDTIYYHNFLRIYPDPVTMELDYDTGLISKQPSEYFLEMRASLTLEDVGAYFLTKGKMYEKMVLKEAKRVYGAIKWLFEKYEDIELILYMIEATNKAVKDERTSKITTPTQLQEHYSEAVAMREFKKNECTLNGDTKVVPRKRVLSNRSGLLDKQIPKAVF